MGMSTKTIPSLLLCTALMLSAQGIAFAKKPPIPISKKQSLESASKSLKHEENKKEELEENVKKIQKDLRSTKEKLVYLGSSIQSNEKKLTNLQGKIKDNEAEKAEIEASLEKDHRYISRLVLALQRIRRIPPEALIVKPDAPLETAQSAMLLGNILPTIHKDAKQLREQIKKLEEVTTALKTQRSDALKTSKALTKEHETLAVLSEQRQSLYQRTNRSLKEQKAQVDKISKQVKNLNELVARLEEEKKLKAQAKARMAKSAKNQKPVKIASVTRAMPGSNASQLPVSGFIKTGFNQEDNFGAQSKGIEISASSGALVVAPMEGTIRFAGPFKNYKNLIIIEHSKGYHSLIAGLNNIDVNVGSEVSSGEPLGRLNFTSDQDGPVLYYELRHKGKPINPAKRLKGFS